jgi:hypothetical protein
MTYSSEMLARPVDGGQIPVVVQSFCSELSRTGQMYVRQISAFINEIAPNPGSVVYVHLSKLGGQVDGVEPAVFSAIDVCTDLQVAQIHLASTVGGLLSFVDVLIKQFPFPIQQIRTFRESPFCGTAGKGERHNFSAIVAQRGILHTVISDRSRDALHSITSRLLFSKMADGTNSCISEREHCRALAQFLLYHNNYRSIPWLDGNTPIQRLKTFSGFASLHSFCPMEEPNSYEGFPGLRAGRQLRAPLQHIATIQESDCSSGRRKP